MKPFHNYAKIEDDNLDWLANLGLKFVPCDPNTSHYKEMITEAWKTFKKELTTKFQTNFHPAEFNEYLTMTKQELDKLLANVKSRNYRNLPSRTIKTIEKLEKENLALVCTDKNLGVALISTQEFEDLEKSEIAKLKVMECMAPENLILQRLKQ